MTLRERIAQIRADGPRAPLVFPDTVAQWPAVARDALVACWSLIVAAAAGEAPPGAAPEDAESFEAVLRHGAAVARRASRLVLPPTKGTTYFAGPVLFEPDAATAERQTAMAHGQPWALAAQLTLLADLVPLVREDNDSSAAEHAAWAALATIAPKSLLPPGRWPVEVIPDPHVRDQFLVAWHPGNLPGADAAQSWLDGVRAAARERAAELRAVLLRDVAELRLGAVKEALRLAAELAPEGSPARRLAGEARAAVELDAALHRAVADLLPRLHQDAAALGAYLRETGEAGRSVAGAEPARLGVALAFALWCDVVAPRLALAHPPAVPHVVAAEAALSLAETITIEEKRDDLGVQLFLRFRSGETRMVAPDRSASASLSPDVAATVRAGLMRFSSVLAFRVFVWCVEQAYRIAQDPAFDSRKFAPKRELAGGCAQIARELEITDKGAPDKIREILSAMAFRRWPLPDGKEGNLLGFIEESAEDAKRRARAPGQGTRGRKPRAVTLTFLDPLCPGYAGAMARDTGTTLRERTDRKLVPIPPVEPRFVGRDNEHAPQAAFWLRLLCELRRRAPEIAARGGAAFTADALAGLAGPKLRHAIAIPGDDGAPPRRGPVWYAALDRWTHAPKGAPPPILDVVAGSLASGSVVLHLGQNYPAERAWLEARGEEELRASAQGKKGAEVKAAKRAGEKPRGRPKGRKGAKSRAAG